MAIMVSSQRSSFILGVILGTSCSVLVCHFAYALYLDISGDKTRRLKRNNLSSKRSKPTIEVCVSDIESAKAAVEGGANSLELCSNRLEGGITPSIGFINECVLLCKSCNVQVHVLIRPRPGNFHYSNAEFEVIQRDVIAAEYAGADGMSLII